MKYLQTLGRILVCVPLLDFGIGHFTKAGIIAFMAPFGGTILIYFAGGFLLLAGISLLLEKFTFWSMILCGCFLLLTAFLVQMRTMLHASDPLIRIMCEISMIKDFG